MKISTPQENSNSYFNLLDAFPCYCHPNYCYLLDNVHNFNSNLTNIYPHEEFCHSQILHTNLTFYQLKSQNLISNPKHNLIQVNQTQKYLFEHLSYVVLGGRDGVVDDGFNQRIYQDILASTDKFHSKIENCLRRKFGADMQYFRDRPWVIVNGTKILHRHCFTFSFEKFISKNIVPNLDTKIEISKESKIGKALIIRRSNPQHSLQNTLLLSTYYYNETFQNYAQNLYSGFCKGLAQIKINPEKYPQLNQIYKDATIFNPQYFSCFDHFMCSETAPDYFLNQRILNGRCPVSIDNRLLLCFYPNFQNFLTSSNCPLIYFDFEKYLKPVETLAATNDLSSKTLTKRYYFYLNDNNTEIKFLGNYEIRKNNNNKMSVGKLIMPAFWNPFSKFIPDIELFKPKIEQFYGQTCSAAEIYPQIQDLSMNLPMSSENKSKNKLNLGQCMNFICNRSYIPDALELLKNKKAAHQRFLYVLGKFISSLTLVSSVLIWNIKSLKCWRNELHCHLAFSCLINYLSYIGLYFLVNILAEKNNNTNKNICDDSWIYNFFSRLLNDDNLTFNFLFGLLCKTLNILQLYGLISTFFWMFVEGLNIYIVCFHVYFTFPKKWYFVIGWVLPAVVLILWVVVTIIYGQPDLCFNSTAKNLSFDINSIYITPILILLFLNFFILIKIILILKHKAKQSNSLNKAEDSINNSICKAILTLIPLLGVQYLFNPVGLSCNSIWYTFSTYFNIISNSLGGFYIGLRGVLG